MQIMPVAQLNTRESLSTLIDRPTGLLFNAFAMSYAAIVCLAIGLNQFLKNKKLNKPGLIIFLTSLIAIFLSGTRTSLWLTFLISISIVLVHINIFSKIQTKAIPIILILIGAGAPFILLFIGSKTGNVEWATLNGRTQMWSCVDQKIGELIPLGVGLDEAFPPKFCADSGWFSNLRHPENMFLLSLVESGPLGFLSYVSLFIFTLWISIKALGKKYILPLAITVTFLLSCLIYVSLFHYLPFLPNRPADRGIFNFHFFYLVWVWVLRETKKSIKETDLSR
jgi:O-antigen ligase